jgi:alpha-L-rhamnosidase
VLDFPDVNLVPTEVPPITTTSFLRDPIQSFSKDGKRIYKFERNITGWVSVKVKGVKGSQVVIRHAEILDTEGNLYTRNLRKAKATDRYILADSKIKTLEPIFTYHGFQYIEIDGDVEIIDIEAMVVHSNIKEIAKFESSNVLLNTLVQNIKNSQRANFFSVPTDCPQRDERLGWSGDIQSFSRTAVNLYDCQYFLSSWLRQLSHSQLKSGAVTSVVPNVLDIYQGPGAEQGGLAGWGDASTIVPWNLYQAYKDEEMLGRQIPSMRKWVTYMDNKVDKSGLIEDTEGQIGDWLDPDAPFGFPHEAKVNMGFVVNAFHSYSALLVGKSLLVLGQKQEAEKYLKLAASIAKKSWSKWGDEVINTSTGCALALEFEMLSDAESKKVASALSDIVFANNGKATYGLVGTARILPALSRNGKLPAALKALFNVECPGWLHQVNQGATTIWERWDSIQADGSIDEEPHFWKGVDVGMNSLNHYHLGSIGDWIIENIGGIALTKDHPAYEIITFSPQPNSDVDWCKTTLETPFGIAEMNWESNNGIRGDITIPPGSKGLINFPLDEGQVLKINDITHSAGNIELGSGQYTFTTDKRK